MFILFLTVTISLGADKDRLRVRVKSLSTNSETFTSTSPGQAYTACYWGDNSLICNQYYIPPEERVSGVGVINQVELNGMVHTISCSQTLWIWSTIKCAQLRVGDTFNAEIQGKTMWVEYARGGNQGKVIKAKYHILDIRPKQ